MNCRRLRGVRRVTCRIGCAKLRAPKGFTFGRGRLHRLPRPRACKGVGLLHAAPQFHCPVPITDHASGNPCWRASLSKQAPVAEHGATGGGFDARFLPWGQSIGGLPQRLTLLCGVSGGGAKLRFRALFLCLVTTPAPSPGARIHIPALGPPGHRSPCRSKC